MGSEDEDENDKKSKTTSAILEMLKEAGVSTKSLEEEKHTFWDTQVRCATRVGAVNCAIHY